MISLPLPVASLKKLPVKNRLALALALAGSWAITEWLRATMFTGFAWNPIGVVLAEFRLVSAGISKM